MQITKAVILAAGYGTRILPASKSVPKEMLNIYDRPAIHYVVEELVESGITDILIVLSRGKQTIEDYFDSNPELEDILERKNAHDKLKEIRQIPKLAKISFIRQQTPKGTGDAVLYAEGFVGNEPFIMAYADDIFPVSKDVKKNISPASKKLVDAVAGQGAMHGAVAMSEVSDELIVKYSSLQVEEIDGKEGVFRVSDMNEKPTLSTKFSNYAILGRCALPPTIFSLLKELTPGAGGEIQLTDAMAQLAREGKMYGADISENKRFDMGNKIGVLKANFETAMADYESQIEIRDFIFDFFKDDIDYEKNKVKEILEKKYSNIPQPPESKNELDVIGKVVEKVSFSAPDNNKTDEEDVPNYFL